MRGEWALDIAAGEAEEIGGMEVEGVGNEEIADGTRRGEDGGKVV